VPAVYADGSICLDILQNQWSPIYDVAAVLTSIQASQHASHCQHGTWWRKCALQTGSLTRFPLAAVFTVRPKPGVAGKLGGGKDVCRQQVSSAWEIELDCSAY